MSDSIVTWHKVTGKLAWRAYESGVCRAKFEQDPRGHTRAWVDSGNGWQEIRDLSFNTVGVKQWERFCEYAIDMLDGVNCESR